MNYIKAIFEKDSIWIKSLIIIFISFFLGILFTGIIHVLLSLFHITDETLKLKWMQLFSATGMFVCASFVLAYLFSNHVRQFLSLRNPRVEIIILAALSMLIVIPVINFIGNLNDQIAFPESLKFIEEVLRTKEKKLAELTIQLLTSGNTFGGLVLNLLIMAIIPALGEELLFRGVIQNSIDRNLNNKRLAVWITAFLFSAVHLQFYGFVPRLLLGAYFGYLLIWSKSIWVPIAAHFVNNAIIVLYFFFKKENTLINLETIGTTNSSNSPDLICGISVLLFVFIVYLICESTKARKHEGAKARKHEGTKGRRHEGG